MFAFTFISFFLFPLFLSLFFLFYDVIEIIVVKKNFSDNAFGKCISYKDGTEGGEEGEGGEDFYEYQIGSDFLRLLKKELENLIKNGYRWSHVYTQCVIKSLLFSYRYQ